MSAPSSQQSVLEARGLQKHFLSGSERIEVLVEVSLAVAGGETLSIRGASGSGKSTLLNLLAGIEQPDAGTVLWGGEEVGDLQAADLPRRRAARIGFIFQFFHLVQELNTLENVILPARMTGLPLKVAKERAEYWLERMALGDRLRSLPAHLSGGERQRVAIARSLMNEPSVILADEPTGNLDETTSASVMESLLSIVREAGTALILVTHSPSFAQLAQTRKTLSEGKLE